jgi:uncharacterized protein with PQ loop repeat
MVHKEHGLHHFHKRKRASQKLEPYPSKDKWKRLMDRIIYIIVFVGPLMTIPQVTTIWFERNASGVSVISWGSYIIIAGFWLIYAGLHREKPLILSYCIWIIIEVLIVIGALVYG